VGQFSSSRARSDSAGVNLHLGPGATWSSRLTRETPTPGGIMSEYLGGFVAIRNLRGKIIMRTLLESAGLALLLALATEPSVSAQEAPEWMKQTLPD
jgi:hypothetical protein